jgi:hypothetical protein
MHVNQTHGMQKGRTMQQQQQQQQLRLIQNNSATKAWIWQLWVPAINSALWQPVLPELVGHSHHRGSTHDGAFSCCQL